MHSSELDASLSGLSCSTPVRRCGLQEYCSRGNAIRIYLMFWDCFPLLRFKEIRLCTFPKSSELRKDFCFTSSIIWIQADPYIFIIV